MVSPATLGRWAAACGLFLASWYCAGFAMDAPRGLVADAAEQTIGPVRQQETGAATFRLANHSRQPVEIVDVVRS